MPITNPMPLRDVENQLSEVVDQVARERDRVVITRHGRPAAVVMSVDELESLGETLDIAGPDDLTQQIQDSLRELAVGEAETLSKEELLAEFAR
ncbi:type II toxin-antitoxin system Phd/YefM family antitoxin [Tessaracoccus caeni]|uniref:type II toxin-antitoxin system Phd/YefM family antitoxin n=1 Tax=Tessaracoccus caeni TaxID=3031239 RepID=UPI0023D9F220|nr:type II toxin-antitoxin system Phd/YefM family antitoxin [Tessaracoccus caeni]MDF1489424.1 type II toxin-antitoxin system Phd/YefM family antitoxin [Tessaracoccus caeni]